jgi:protein-tyrosine phosphatase
MLDRPCAKVADVVDVLFLCTGNLCRSPSAEWFLRHQVSEFGPEGVAVASAGTLGAYNAPPSRLLKEAAAFGMDLSDHVPRRFDADMVRRSDFIIGMAREHVREVVLADPPSFGRTFTLRDIVRRGIKKGPRQPEESLDQWLDRMHAGRRHLDLIGEAHDEDIPDPMGGSSEDFRNMLTEVASCVRTLHGLIWR